MSRPSNGSIALTFLDNAGRTVTLDELISQSKDWHEARSQFHFHSNAPRLCSMCTSHLHHVRAVTLHDGTSCECDNPRCYLAVTR